MNAMMIRGIPGRATVRRTMFRLEYGVKTRVRAPGVVVWSLLTDASRFPKWNSTVTSIEGRIAPGERICLRVPIAPDRAFRLKISAFAPPERMVWESGFGPMFRGRRVFTVEPSASGESEFSMVETFSGLLLPMIAGSLPNLAPAFTRFAEDLKREAEQSFHA